MVQESNKLVRDSRTGDVFHYRWAARRALMLLDSASGLEKIVIEGDDSEAAKGEYSLDMVEVYRSGKPFDRIKYQFKYSVEHSEEPMGFSLLKKTFQGFQENFVSQKKDARKQRYLIVTNRPISDELKQCLNDCATGRKCSGRLALSFLKTVKLKGENLKRFCKSVSFQELEDTLDAQLWTLRKSVTSVTAGVPPLEAVNALVDMVAQKALPKRSNVITVEDVLSYFCKGVSSIEAFYPAPPKFDPPEEWIRTKGYQAIRDRVLQSHKVVFVHAPGGVGKTVTLRLLSMDVPDGSIAILFDCYASGEYTNRLQYRHLPEKAFVQIANELSAKGLCDPLIMTNGLSAQLVLEGFNHRLQDVLRRLRVQHPDAGVYVFIDAADNAKMAAQDAKESCFVDYLLQSRFGEGCHFIFSARTSRMREFWPKGVFDQIEIKPFDVGEVFQLLKRKFADANSSVAKKLFVRTSGSPRTIAGVLSDCKTLKDVIDDCTLAPLKDYDAFLENKYEETLKRYSSDECKRLERLCRCLVLLPPNVPIKILSAAAGVSDDFVSGFISDWERPLWRNQEHVHFRDEPTESWFRGKFAEEVEDLDDVISALTPLAVKFVYAARALPALLLRANKYGEVARLANTDELLPEGVHLAERKSLRLERLRFAVSAMIKAGRTCDALKLAMAAGNQVSESDRREVVLKQNLVLASRLIEPELVREMAAARQVSLEWQGSENLCSAVLFSVFDDTKDSAETYLASSIRWLLRHIEECNKKTDDPYRRRPDLANEAYLCASAVLNIHGVTKCLEELSKWSPGTLRSRATALIAGDLSALCDKDTLEALFAGTQDDDVRLGILAGAMDYGKDFEVSTWAAFADKLLRRSLSQWVDRDDDNGVCSVIAKFAVWLVITKKDRKRAAQLLRKHCLPTLPLPTWDTPRESIGKYLFCYAFSMACENKPCKREDVIARVRELHGAALDRDISRTERRIDKLLPVYECIARACVADDVNNARKVLGLIPNLHDEYELFHQDRKRLILDIVDFVSMLVPDNDAELIEFVKRRVCVNPLTISDVFTLAGLLNKRGQAVARDVCFGVGMDRLPLCRCDIDETPDELSDIYVQAAKTCISYDCADARGYFAEAIDVLSKCGDELLPRWRTVTDIADRASKMPIRPLVPRKLIYDFTRCGEYVRKAVCRDKYYDREHVFSILVNFDPAYAWATFSRWRDRRVGCFLGDFSWVIDMFLKRGIMSPEVAWSLRDFDADRANVELARRICESKTSTVQLRRTILDETLRYYGQSEYSAESERALAKIAKEFAIETPKCAKVKSSEEMPWNAPKEDELKYIADFQKRQEFSASDSSWLFDAFVALKPIWKDDRKAEAIFSKVSDCSARDFLCQLAEDGRLDHFDCGVLISRLPEKWKRKPGVVEILPTVLERLVSRYLSARWMGYVSEILDVAKNFGCESRIVTAFLRQAADSRFLSGEEYFCLVSHGLRILTPKETVKLLEHAVSMAATGMPREFGDGDWNLSVWPKETFEELTRDVLWTAMGDPDVGIRWRATHAVVNELTREAKTGLPAFLCRLAKEDFSPCVSQKLPSYVQDSRLHFLLALSKVAREISGAIQNCAGDLISFLRKQDHVLIRYLGWAALRSAGVSEKSIIGINPLDELKIHRVKGWRWGIKANVSHSLTALLDSGNSFRSGYDFGKHWISHLMALFGLSGEMGDDLLAAAVGSFSAPDFSFLRNADPRNGQFYDDGSTDVPESGVPDVSDYNFYLAYHGLMVMAGWLLKHQPVIWGSDEERNPFVVWMKAQLPLFAPDVGMWLADVRGVLPKSMADLESVRAELETKPLKDIDAAYLLTFSCEGEKSLSIDGRWAIGLGQKDFDCTFNCALVPKNEALKIRSRLQRMKDPTVLALPTSFDDPNGDCYNHGNINWRGLFEVAHSYPRHHLDEKDSHAGGLQIAVFHIARTICRDLSLKRAPDHLSWNMTHDNMAFKPYYWSQPSQSRRGPSETHGETLNVSLDFLCKLCQKYDSELLIEMVLKRDRHYYRGQYAERDERERCYRYVLFAPKRGVY